MFERFKKRILLERVTRGLLYGLSAGLLVSAILVMSFMLSDLEDWWYFLISGLVGLVVWAGVFTGYFLSNKVDDKETAKRIDSTYNLEEKASTMLAFSGQDSLLIDKQREDAKINVKKQNPHRMTVKLAVLNIPFLVLGLSFLTASSFTDTIQESVRARVSVPEDDFDDETDSLIDQLKDYIGKRLASEAFKEKLYAILEELRADLKNDTNQTSRKIKVERAERQVDEALDEVNTKEELGAALKETSLSDLGTALEAGDIDAIDAALKALYDSTDTIVSTDGLIKAFEEWCNALKTAVNESGIASGDANRSTLSDLESKLEAIYENVEDKAASSDYATPQMITKLITDSCDQAKNAIEVAETKLNSDIAMENANTQLAEDIKKLMEQLIAPYSDDLQTGDDSEVEGSGNGQDADNTEEGEVGDQQDGNQETGGSGENGGADGGQGEGSGDNGNGSGAGSGGQEGQGNGGNGQGEGAGIGSGETQYGSTDKVYTGSNGSSEYGDVLEDYQGDASDDARNTGDEELQGAVSDYLNKLYGEKGGNVQP